MARPAQITLPPIVRGDTWDGISVSLSSSGTAFADTLTSVRMIFHDAAGDTDTLTLTSTGGNISITSAANWQFTVNAITPFPLSPGTQYWNIETTDSGGSIKTYMVGTIQILND
jgi:hypothetical protein